MKTLKARRVVVLSGGDATSTGQAAALRGAAQSLGAKGVAARTWNPKATRYRTLFTSLRRQRPDAILLAVFLAFWMWIYTYKVDAWKFWLNLGLTVVTLGIWSLVAWPWSIIDAARRSDQWYAQFPNGDALQRQQALQPMGIAGLPAPPPAPPRVP